MHRRVETNLKEYFARTIDHYANIDSGVALSDLQIAPIWILKHKQKKSIIEFADSAFEKICNCQFDEMSIPFPYFASDYKIQESYLVNPFVFCFIEAFCWYVFDNFIEARPDDVEVYFSGGPNNTLFGKEKNYLAYSKAVNNISNQFSYVCSFDVSQNYKSVNVDNIIDSIREKTSTSIPEHILQIFRKCLFLAGRNNLLILKTGCTSRFLSTIIEFDDIDKSLFKKLTESSYIKDFKIMRNGDDCHVLFNSDQNKHLVCEFVNNTYKKLLSKYGLTLNVKKTKCMKASDLSKTIYSDSTKTKLTSQLLKSINKGNKAACVLAAKTLLQTYKSHKWSVYYTYYAIRLLIINSYTNCLPNNMVDELKRIVNLKSQRVYEYINKWIEGHCLNEYKCTESFVTLIIRVNNNEQTLDKCLSSVSRQTTKGMKIICVDDGSTDNSLSIIKKYALCNENLQSYSIPHKGKVYAREIGVKLANSQYVTFCDADDYVSENYHETVFDAINQHPQTDMVVYGYTKFRENSLESCVPTSNNYWNYQSVADVDMLINSNFELGSCMAVFKRDLLVDVLHQNYDMSMFEDFAFTYEALTRSTSPVFIKDKLYWYNKNNASSSTNIANINIDDLITCCNHIISRIEAEKFPKKYIHAICQLIVTWIAIEIKRLYTIKVTGSSDLSSLGKFKTNIAVSSRSYIKQNHKDGFHNIANRINQIGVDKLQSKWATQILTFLRKKQFVLLINYLLFDNKLFDLKKSYINNTKHHDNKETDIAKSPKISFIIPAHNCQDSLEECVYSILNQVDISAGDYEIIVVENGSTDNSLEVCNELSSKFANVQTYKTRTANVNQARMFCVSKSKSDYVVFVDADDCCYLNMIHEIINVVYLTPNVDLISFDVDRVTNGKHVIMQNSFCQGYYDEFDMKYVVSQNVVFNMVDSLWGYCFKKSLIEKTYCKDDDITRGEDTVTIYHTLATAKSMYVLRECLYQYNCKIDYNSISKDSLASVIAYIKQRCASVDNIDSQLKRLTGCFKVN